MVSGHQRGLPLCRPRKGYKLGCKDTFFLLFFCVCCLALSEHLTQGYQTRFHQGPHQLGCCLQRAEIILGLYKCNYSLAVKELKLHSAFEGNCQADVAPGENEFDTPDLTPVAV